MQEVEKHSTPLVVKLALGVAIFGLAFPIYGISFGLFKLTAFRAGIFLLVPLLFTYGFRFKNRYSANILVLFFIFALIRTSSLLLISENKGSGLQQLVWFLEGVLFLLIVNSFSQRFEDFFKSFLRLVFFICSVSIIAMAIQFIMLLFGGSWLLPFSTSQFGYEEATRYWTYPFQGGQVIGPFWEYNMAGSMCAFFFALFLPYAFEESNIMRINRFVIRAILIVTVFALIGTGSKQGFLAMLVASWVLILKNRVYKKLATVLLLLSVVSATFLIVKTTDTSLLRLLPQTTFDRYETGMAYGDLSGGRIGYMRELLGTVNLDNIAFGIGEGMGIHAAHNAYLITLQEDGLIGLLFLVWLSFYFLYKTSVVRWGAQPGSPYFPLKVSAIGIVLVWILLIFINWAQMNVSLSFLYLPAALMYLNHSSEMTRGLVRIDLQGRKNHS